jgi:hypothetical protein
LTTRDQIDTHEADNLGRNWYTFLTAGRNPYVPQKFCPLPYDSVKLHY